MQEVDLCWGELALSEGERVLLARPGVTLQNGTLVGSGEGSSAPLVDIQADRCALKGLTVRGGGAGAAVEVRQARGVVLMECAVESCFGAGLLACGDIVNVDVIDTTVSRLPLRLSMRQMSCVRSACF